MPQLRLWTFLILIIGFQLESYNQNLVPNGSFEFNTSCPNGPGEIILSSPWTDPTNATADLFDTCSTSSSYDIPMNIVGYQNANTGHAYAGIVTYVNTITNAREYIQVQLLDSLDAGKTYYVGFYVSWAEGVQYAANGFSAYFSDTAISCGSCFLNYAPQFNYNDTIIKDTSSWVLMTGSFVAQGGEKFITIGNFNADDSTQNSLVNSGGVYVSAYYYIDDVYVGETPVPVGVKELEPEFVNVKVYPNPTNELLNVEYIVSETENAEFMLFDITGKLITKKILPTQNNLISFNYNELNGGVYFYTILVNNKVVKRDKFILIK